MTSIKDAEATKTSILAAVDKIKSKAKPQDVFVMYYAWHGVMSTGSASERPEFYLVPFNVIKLYEADEMLRERAISAKEVAEFSKQIKAQKQLFVLDACQSGGALNSLAMRGAVEEKAISQLARSTGFFFYWQWIRWLYLHRGALQIVRRWPGTPNFPRLPNHSVTKNRYWVMYPGFLVIPFPEGFPAR